MGRLLAVGIAWQLFGAVASAQTPVVLTLETADEELVAPVVRQQLAERLQVPVVGIVDGMSASWTMVAVAVGTDEARIAVKRPHDELVFLVVAKGEAGWLVDGIARALGHEPPEAGSAVAPREQEQRYPRIEGALLSWAGELVPYRRRLLRPWPSNSPRRRAEGAARLSRPAPFFERFR